MRTYGRVIPAPAGHKFSVHHHPVGVVAAFSPWNFPMSQSARKIAGALGSGCSVILKAAAETPFGGVKASGYGREGGAGGLENYMTNKNVWYAAKLD